MSSRRWVRDGSSWFLMGWEVRDTGRSKRRDRYVIVAPDGTVNSEWHLAYMHKKQPVLNDAKEAVETRLGHY